MRIQGYVVCKAKRDFMGNVTGGRFVRALSTNPRMKDDEVAVLVALDFPDNVFDPYVVQPMEVKPKGLARAEIVDNPLWDEEADDMRDPRSETV